MRLSEFEQIDEMTVGAGGIDYEWAVYNSIKSVDDDLETIEVIGAGPTGGFNSHDKDLEIKVNGKIYYFEIKQNRNAQMGGTSIKIDPKSKSYVLANPDAVDADAIPFYLAAAKEKDNDIKAYIDFIHKQEPVDLHKNIPYTIPFGSITTDAWEAAKAEGYLAKLNKTVSFDNARTVAKLYNNKDVYYIQIGGAGLFYLGKNPLKLPIPEFTGSVNIEFRLGPAGSTTKIWDNKPLRVRSGGYRCQGRLKTKIKSDYSLDNPQDVIDLFSKK